MGQESGLSSSHGCHVDVSQTRFLSRARTPIPGSQGCPCCCRTEVPTLLLSVCQGGLGILKPPQFLAVWSSHRPSPNTATPCFRIAEGSVASARMESCRAQCSPGDCPVTFTTSCNLIEDLIIMLSHSQITVYK